MIDSPENIHSFLDQKALLFNQTSFIETDPIQVPALFTTKENIEISGFLAATLAWGQRPTIIRNAMKLITLMNNNPIEFLLNNQEEEWDVFRDFKHRTFNGTDCIYFMKSLKNIYQNHGGLEQIFTDGFQKGNTIFSALIHFRKVFFEMDHEHRTEKHVSNVEKGAAAKRLNMYLRWMIRSNKNAVDLVFGSKFLHLHSCYLWMFIQVMLPESSDYSPVCKTIGKPWKKSLPSFANLIRMILLNMILHCLG